MTSVLRPETTKEWSLDRVPSPSRRWSERGPATSVYEILHVHGVGALVARWLRDPVTGDVTDAGISQFTDAEIGWRQ